MKIPVFINTQYVDKEGFLTSDVMHYNDDLSQTLIQGLGDDGWTTPQQTTVNIAAIAPSMPNGTLWYDTDTDQLKVLVAGVVRIVQLV